MLQRTGEPPASASCSHLRAQVGPRLRPISACAERGASQRPTQAPPSSIRSPIPLKERAQHLVVTGTSPTDIVLDCTLAGGAWARVATLAPPRSGPQPAVLLPLDGHPSDE